MAPAPQWERGRPAVRAALGLVYQRSTARKRLADNADGVTDRDADVWESLLAVADLAGGDWPHVARVAAVTLVTASSARKPSVGVLLLRDIRTVFSGSSLDKMLTTDILAALNKMDESPWATIRRGESLDSRGLANRLSKYGIGSKALRIGDEVIKGYSRAQFQDAWSRYLDDE